MMFPKFMIITLVFVKKKKRITLVNIFSQFFWTKSEGKICLSLTKRRERERAKMNFYFLVETRKKKNFDERIITFFKKEERIITKS